MSQLAYNIFAAPKKKKKKNVIFIYDIHLIIYSLQVPNKTLKYAL